MYVYIYIYTYIHTYIYIYIYILCYYYIYNYRIVSYVMFASISIIIIISSSSSSRGVRRRGLREGVLPAPVRGFGIVGRRFRNSRAEVWEYSAEVWEYWAEVWEYSAEVGPGFRPPPPSAPAHGRFPKFHRVFVGPRPWHIEIRHRVKKTSTINLEISKIEIMETDRKRYLASWVPSPPGKHTFQNCMIGDHPRTAGKRKTRYPLV